MPFSLIGLIVDCLGLVLLTNCCPLTACLFFLLSMAFASTAAAATSGVLHNFLPSEMIRFCLLLSPPPPRANRRRLSSLIVVVRLCMFVGWLPLHPLLLVLHQHQQAQHQQLLGRLDDNKLRACPSASLLAGSSMFFLLAHRQQYLTRAICGNNSSIHQRPFISLLAKLTAAEKQFQEEEEWAGSQLVCLVVWWLSAWNLVSRPSVMAAFKN